MNSVEMQSAIEYCMCSVFVFVIQFDFAFQSNLPTRRAVILCMKMQRIDGWYQFSNVFLFFSIDSLPLSLTYTLENTCKAFNAICLD